jgi:hypothetical protein
LKNWKAWKSKDPMREGLLKVHYELGGYVEDSEFRSFHQGKFKLRSIVSSVPERSNSLFSNGDYAAMVAQGKDRTWRILELATNDQPGYDGLLHRSTSNEIVALTFGLLSEWLDEADPKFDKLVASINDPDKVTFQFNPKLNLRGLEETTFAFQIDVLKEGYFLPTRIESIGAGGQRKGSIREWTHEGSEWYWTSSKGFLSPDLETAIDFNSKPIQICKYDRNTEVSSNTKQCYLTFYELPEPEVPKNQWFAQRIVISLIVCIGVLFAGIFWLKRRSKFA